MCLCLCLCLSFVVCGLLFLACCFLFVVGCWLLAVVFLVVVVGQCGCVVAAVSSLQIGCRSWSAAEVRILDLLCLMDPSLVTRIFPAVKKAVRLVCCKYEASNNMQAGKLMKGV